DVYKRQSLGVPREKISAKGGYIKVGEKSHSYGEFVDLAMKEPIPSKPRLKEEREFVYIGKSLPRLDVPEKVEGKALFGIDVFEEGMVYAVVERPPYFGAKPMKVQVEEAKKLPEVVD
ncbi:MAG: hypothetical protein N2Z76_10980, partial [Treponemataceae bacterium]|nr:hypothetical protein [Treponemataceae bacterium]